MWFALSALVKIFWRRDPVYRASLRLYFACMFGIAFTILFPAPAWMPAAYTAVGLYAAAEVIWREGRHRGTEDLGTAPHAR